jgi:hypothetical protein
MPGEIRAKDDRGSSRNEKTGMKETGMKKYRHEKGGPPPAILQRDICFREILASERYLLQRDHRLQREILTSERKRFAVREIRLKSGIRKLGARAELSAPPGPEFTSWTSWPSSPFSPSSPSSLS